MKQSNKKIYFLIESKELYKQPTERIIGKVIDVIISDEKPYIMIKNKEKRKNSLIKPKDL